MEKAVLLVEDDAFLRETIRQELSERGVKVLEAADGDEAIEQIGKRVPDLMLLDLLMPRRDGYAVLHYLKEQSLSFPVVILSNLSDYLDHDKCLKLGAKDYFIKSDMDEDELWPRIQKYL
jgi:DNA-binding response OmpR family regulator